MRPRTLITALATLAILAALASAPSASARLIAPPLPIGTSEAVLLDLQGQTVRAERINWRTGQARQFDFSFLPIVREQNYLQEYTAVLTRHGLWMVGPVIVLLQPDGKTHQIAFGGNQPVAVGLDDGSVLVLGTGRDHYVKEVFRVARKADGGGIEARPVAKPANLSHGANAVRLADGRVLVMDGYWQAGYAWLHDPRRETWEATAPTAGRSNRVALAALPDGRAVAVGVGLAGTRRDGDAHGAILWDPASGHWRALPPLPLSARIESFRATLPSLAVLPDGSLVMAGAMHRHVLLLRARGKDFADHWTLVGTLPGQHTGGVVQALGDREVAVLGGVHPHPNGQCCRDQEAKHRLSWRGDGRERGEAIGLARHDAAVAHRGDLSFIAGGWESFSQSTTIVQASAVAEIIDHRTGRTRELPALPAPLVDGRAQWLDEHRILVKAVAHDNTAESSFRGMDGRGLEMVSPGFLAILDRRDDSWRLLDDPRLRQAALAGVGNGKAVLVDPAARAWTMDLAHIDGEGVAELPRPIRRRQDAVSRLLADGRVIVAGGQVQSDLIAVVAAACPAADCPDQYRGFGSLLPSRRHEILDPAADRWRQSAASRGAGIAAAVRADGRVVKLGLLTPADGSGTLRWLLEESAPGGDAWRELALPAELTPTEAVGDRPCGNYAEAGHCSVQIEPAPEAERERLFLRHRRWDNAINGYRHDLWLRDDASGDWHAVARDLVDDGRLQPLALPAPATVDGAALRGATFGPGRIRLWRQ